MQIWDSTESQLKWSLFLPLNDLPLSTIFTLNGSAINTSQHGEQFRTFILSYKECPWSIWVRQEQDKINSITLQVFGLCMNHLEPLGFPQQRPVKGPSSACSLCSHSINLSHSHSLLCCYIKRYSSHILNICCWCFLPINQQLPSLKTLDYSAFF